MRSRAMQVLALLFVLLAVAVAWLWQQRRAPAPPTEQLVIAANTEYVGACAVVAAQKRGYFAAQGLQVKVLPFSSGKASLHAVLDGKADLATRAANTIGMSATVARSALPSRTACMDALPLEKGSTLTCKPCAAK